MQKDGLLEQKPNGTMSVKPMICYPAEMTGVKLGELLEIRGAAWTGMGTIETVEISTDSGLIWQTATITEPSTPEVGAYGISRGK